MAFPTDPGFRAAIAPTVQSPLGRMRRNTLTLTSGKGSAMAACVICRIEHCVRVLELDHHDTLECSARELWNWLVEEEGMRKSSVHWRLLRYAGLATMYPTRIHEQPKWFVKQHGGQRFSREKENWSPKWAVEFAEALMQQGVGEHNKTLAGKMLRHAKDNEMFREMAMEDMDWAVPFFEQGTLRRTP